MSYSNNPKQSVFATDADLTAVADKLTFTPACPIEVIEFGEVITTASADTAGDGIVLSADVRPTAGSDTARVAGAAGTGTFTHAQVLAATAGAVLKSRPLSPYVVYPGQQVVLKLTNAASAAGAGIAFLTFREAFKADAAVETVVNA